MLLHDLLRQLDSDVLLDGIPNVPIAGVEEDSRRVRPGFLFVARSGAKNDGRAFIPDAAARGAAAAVVAYQGFSAARAVIPLVPVFDIAGAASRLANIHLGEPSRSVRVVGVTGTNGKTTTTYLLRHILNSVGKRCGLIGTVETDDGQSVREASMTTPSGVEIAQLLARMRDSGCEACAIEVSSHALDQRRVEGVTFAGAAFTNLTGDHLDYHQTMENYAAAKARLFEGLDEEAPAIVNAADEWSERMLRDCYARKLWWGFSPDANYRAEECVLSSQTSKFTLATPDGRAPVTMHLVGRHNIANALTAAALAMEAFGLSVHAIACALANAAGAPGRLQSVRCGQPFSVLVDYAHTDDAMDNVLRALRGVTRGKLRVLFGCGGDRDRTKRPRMAAVAERLADVIYVTSDNPRTEEPGAIIDQIMEGFSGRLCANGRLIVEPDRRRAIERVVGDAQEGDVVLLAGKGHENYQIVGTQKRHFDDVEEAQRALRGSGRLV
jgi:UDP-N-acetylmuramoyl-L-alanyl-D-glutamate--2,6-diaminopimelate ligase